MGGDTGALARGLMHLASLAIPKAARALRPDVCLMLRQDLLSEPATSFLGPVPKLELAVPSQLPPVPRLLLGIYTALVLWLTPPRDSEILIVKYGKKKKRTFDLALLNLPCLNLVAF